MKVTLWHAIHTYSTYTIILQLNHLEDYMTYRKLPKGLRMRINDYYLARYGGKWFDEKQILSLVSKSLKEVPKNIVLSCNAFLL